MPGRVSGSPWTISMFFPWWFPQGGFGFFPQPRAGSVEQRLRGECRCDAICDCETVVIHFICTFTLTIYIMEHFFCLQNGHNFSRNVSHYMLKPLLDLVSLSAIMSLWCFKLCDMVVVNQVEVASSWWISVARKGMDVVCSSADTDCDESHVHIKMVFIFFFKWPFSELLSNNWDCCSTYARPGVALWRHSLKPEKTWAEYRNNRGLKPGLV